MDSEGPVARRDAVLVDEWLAALRAENTRNAYSLDLARFAAWLEQCGHRSPLDASPADIERYREECSAGGVADSTLARWMSALRSYYTHAVSRGALGGSPVGQWELRLPAASPTTALSAGDVQALLGACGRQGSRTGALVYLMLFDGLALGEVIDADAGDVTFCRSGATMRMGRRRPADHRLDHRLDRRTASVLQEHLGARDDGPLLVGESRARAGNRLTRFGADYLLKRAGDDAALAVPVTAGALRRTFVATLHAAGATAAEIRERLGHRDVRTTARHLPQPSPEG